MRSLFARRISCFLHFRGLRRVRSSSTLCSYYIRDLPTATPPEVSFGRILESFRTRWFSPKPASYFFSNSSFHHSYATSVTEEPRQEAVDASGDSNGEMEPIDSWEEEDEADPEVGDGGDGGGVVLTYCPWGERALSIAREVLQESGDGMELYAFKTSFRGYIYVRLDKLSNEYGCPNMEEIESFSRRYKKKLDEVGAKGEIPDDLALEVSSPGADRLLRVPDDLLRFKNLPMTVSYMEESDRRSTEKNGVYFLDSIERESGVCVWKLADVRENRDPSTKGRPLSRKQKDSRLKLPYPAIKKVTLYISY